jgi:hypothetical protein
VHTSSAREPQPAAAATKEKVGRLGDNRYQTPTNQILTPAGITVELPRIRPQAIALSPDGRLLVTSGKTSELIVIDPKSGKVLEKVALHNSQDPPKAAAKDASKDKAADDAEKNPDMPAEKSPDMPAEKNPDMPAEKPAASTSTEIKPDKSAQLSFTGSPFTQWVTHLPL